MPHSNRDVRFSPDSGHLRPRSKCPLSANIAQSSIVVCLTPTSEPVAVISTVADRRRLACWCSFRAQRGKLRGRYIHSLVFITEVVKNKQADRRGQIVLFARTVDLSDQFRQRHLLGMRDFFQVSPERIFKADAGLVPINDDGPFNHRGFHRAPHSPLYLSMAHSELRGVAPVSVVSRRCFFIA